MNFIYSLIVAVLSGFITKKYIKHSKLFGALMGLVSYVGSKQFIKTDE